MRRAALEASSIDVDIQAANETRISL